MAHVFISYHKGSSRAYASKLAHYLIKHGFDVWIDDQIDYGTDWEQIIFEALDAANALVVIMTPEAWESKWVRRERQYAENKQINIFPLRVGEFVFPTYLATQFADLRMWKLPPAEFLTQLEEAGVARKTVPGQNVAVTPSTITQSLPQEVAQSSKIPSLVSIVSLVAGFGILIGVAAVFATQATNRAATGLTPTVISTLPVTPTATPIGGGTGEIAFHSSPEGNNEIYVMQVANRDVRNLTNNPERDGYAAWSPDGSQIAFATNRDGNFEIYVMDADGTHPHRLTNNQVNDAFPSWSPDGLRIAYESPLDGDKEIYTINVDGSDMRNLTHNDVDDFFPAWSPDGLQIAFASSRDGNSEIYIMNADGSMPRRLTNHNSDDSFPAWSPDGRRIAFYSDRDGNREIYDMSFDGADFRRLTRNAVDDWLPAWSPDGMQIAFSSLRDGNAEIYIMNADGTDQRRLTHDQADSFSPAWHP